VAYGQLRQDVVGVPHVVFLVLGAAAPMAAIVGAMPVALGLGNGKGIAGAYVLAGVALLLFSVGYAAMSRHVIETGAFYSYVERGLGRHAGGAAAYAALVAYNALAIALSAVFAFFAASSFDDVLGIDLPWQAWWGAGVAAVALLSYRPIDLTARTLGIALVGEVLILLVFDAAVLADKGFAGFSLSVFSPEAVSSGAVGIGILYAFTSFIGFEAAAIYGEEAKDPERTVGRATLISVAIVGVFYTLTTWAAISAYGADRAQSAAAQDPSTFMFAANQIQVGTFATKVMEILIVTSLFAAFLAVHQGAARYLFAVAREGLTVRALGSTHRRHGTPHVAQAVQLGLVVLVVGFLAILGHDPYLEIAAPIIGLGTLGVVLLQAAASVAIVAFFRRRADRRLWTTVIAPLAGGAGLVATAVLGIANFGTLAGSGSGVTDALPWLYVVAVVAGAAISIAARGAPAKS
jgi:amino acid transporter